MDVFISHVEENKEIADTLAKSLEEAEISCWYYERDSIPGLSYLVQVGNAIRQAKVILLIVSRDSLSSHQVKKEIIIGHENDKSFIPLLVDISHVEFKNRQPEWDAALGAATSVTIGRSIAKPQIDKIIKGVKELLRGNNDSIIIQSDISTHPSQKENKNLKKPERKVKTIALLTAFLLLNGIVITYFIYFKNDSIMSTDKNSEKVKTIKPEELIAEKAKQEKDKNLAKMYEEINNEKYYLKWEQIKKVKMEHFGTYNHIRKTLFSNDKTKLYAGILSGYLCILDLKTFEYRKIRVGENPVAILLDEKGEKIVTINTGSKDVNIIDLKSEKIIETIDIKDTFSIDWAYMFNNNIFCSGFNDKFWIDTQNRVAAKISLGEPWYQIQTSIAQDENKKFGYGMSKNAIIKINMSGSKNNVIETIEIDEFKENLPFHAWGHSVVCNNAIYAIGTGNGVGSGMYIYDLNKKSFIGIKRDIFKHHLPPISAFGTSYNTIEILEKDKICFLSSQDGTVLIDLINNEPIAVIKPDGYLADSKVLVDGDRKIMYITGLSEINVIRYEFKRKQGIPKN